MDAAEKIAKAKPDEVGFKIGLPHAPTTGFTLTLGAGVNF